MIKKYAGLLALLAAASLPAACGSGGSSDTEHTPSQQSTQQSTQQSSTQQSPSTATQSASTPATTSAAAGFCAHIAPAGKGPANAFQAIQLWDAGTARRTAMAEAKLMKGAVPPAEIAKDWKSWTSYVQAVLRATGGKGGSLESLGALDQKSRGAQKRLTDYAFAHCA